LILGKCLMTWRAGRGVAAGKTRSGGSGRAERTRELPIHQTANRKRGN
jgi:hypothetical protein